MARAWGSQLGDKNAVRVGLAARALVIAALGVGVAACTSAPELRHSAGQSKQPVPGNQEAAARYEAMRQGVPLRSALSVAAHDAADVKALEEKLEQLKQQINLAQRVRASDDEARVLTPKRFEVSTKDTSLIGVVVRWAQLTEWRVYLNGALLDAPSFPFHTVAYADIPLALSAKGVGHDELALAIGALLQAHQQFKERIVLTLALRPGTQELLVTSELARPTSSVVSTLTP